ncbi:MAG TPA: hypothetical protein VHC97_16060 [Thermoanaerobaculia bacterium]|jgi:hypothetical protein|nr:hypothetical protein [Thermoanaerobaculia bacterium]
MTEPTLNPPEISIVVASRNAGGTVFESLQAVRDQAVREGAELIVVDGSVDGSSALLSSRFPEAVLIAADPGLLVPQLWGLGIERSGAPLVALATACCIPEDGWLASLLRTVREQPRNAGWGGPIDGPAGGRPLDWAVYFSRYSAYLPPVAGREADEIPGDNAVYRRLDLEQDWSPQDGGFWETLVHRRLRARGQTLWMAPDAVMRLGPSPGARAFARDRYHHGRHFGSTRPAASPLARWLRAASAPALAPLLLFRIGRRVARHRRDWLSRYLRALPWLAVFIAAWSLGEMNGYLRGPRGPRGRG